MSLLSVGLTCLLAVSAVAGAPLERRAVLDHNAVVSLGETIPQNSIGQLYLKYKPYLKIMNGCVPFPAVDASGNTNGGLSPEGDPEGGCDKSTGQMYVRSAKYNNKFAIMYSWYWPKDEPSPKIGHRHDWEAIVVWIDNEASPNPTLLGVAASAHGKFNTNTTPYLSGTHPLIKYESIWPFDHTLGFTPAMGGQQPLVAWESLKAPVQKALTDANFGSANVPFKDANFVNNLGKAAL